MAATVNLFPGSSYTSVTTNQMADVYNTYIVNPSDTSDLGATATAIFNGAGKTIRLGGGDFDLSTTLSMLYNGCQIIGAGVAATTITVDTAALGSNDAIFIDKVYGTLIRDLTITATSARSAGNAIHVRGGDINSQLDPAYNLADSNYRIENVDMTKQFTGIYVNNDTNNYNWRGYVRGGRHSQISANGHGIWIDTSGGSSTTFGASHFISDFWVGQTPTTTNAGIRLSGTGDATITNTEIYGATYAVLIDPAANGFLTSVTFNGGFIDRSGTACVSIAPNASVARFGEIRFNGTWFAGCTSGNVVDITGAAAKLILFSNCTLFSGEGAPGWCAKVNASTNVQFTGCSFAAATTGGVLFTGSSSGFKVTSSMFTGAGVGTSSLTTLPTGIQVDAGCDHYTIADNDLSDAGVGSTAKITNTPGTAANQRIEEDNVTA